MPLTLEQLAVAYELRQSGLCWKKVSQHFEGSDPRHISAQVSHLVRHGIRKGRDGHARQPGQPARVPREKLQRAAKLRAAGYPWSMIGPALGVDPHRLRCAHRYASRQKGRP